MSNPRLLLKLGTGKYFAHSEGISDPEKSRPLCYRVATRKYSFGKTSLGQGSSFPFPRFFVSGMTGHPGYHSIVFTAQGDQCSCLILTSADTLRLSSWTHASSEDLSAKNPASVTPPSPPASLNTGEAAKSSCLHSCPPRPHSRNPGVCAAACYQVAWSLDSSGPPCKVMAFSRAE